MCLFPKKILNPSLSWHYGMPKYIVVSCNTCSECRAKKQQEWFIRATEEYRHCRTGSNFFVTLTFRNEDLPIYEDKRDFVYDEELDHVLEDTHVYRRYKKPATIDYRFACFDGDMITSFKKKFRIYLQRRFPNYDVTGVKFLICPEYGENYRRSHYHCQIDSPFFIPVKDFKDICSRAWIYGWIGSSKNKGYLIQSEGACQYVAKYTNKDMYFYNSVMDKYLDKDKLSEPEYEYRYERVKNFLPRLRVSSNFGSSFADRIKAMPNPIQYCCLLRPVQRLSKAEKVVHYALPKYIESKLCREVDKYASKILGRPFYKYTEFGKQLRKARFEHRLKLDAIEVSKFQDEQYILDTLSKCKHDSFKREYISKNLPELFKHITLEDLTFYRRFLRYLPVKKYGKHTAFWYNRRKTEIIDEFYKRDIIPKELYDLFMYDFSKMPPRNSCLFHFDGVGNPLDEVKLKTIETLSDLGEFVNYEKACKLIDEYYVVHSHQRSKIIDERNERIDKVRSELVDYILYDARCVDV